MTEEGRGDEALETIVRRAQAGDEDAFKHLVRGHYELIHRWALAATGDPDDADDVTQRVLVTLHRKLGSFDGRSRFTTWLYRVVANAAHNVRRRGARRVSLVERARAQRPPRAAEPPAVEERLERGRVARLVKFLMEELPGRQREILDLVDLQGYEPAEVSRMMGVKPVTVRTHLLRARRKIRRRILEDHPELLEGYRS